MPLTKPEFSPGDLHRIIQAELAEHPQARYADLYKLLHQVCYGPTHILPDREAIAAGIRQELASLPTQNRAPFQDIGCGRAFARLNLTALASQETRDARAGKEHPQILLLTQCVLASRLEGSYTLEDWRQTWEKARPLVLEYISPTPSELALIQACLTTGDMPSHTAVYRELYQPHYRVIHHSLTGKFTNI